MIALAVALLAPFHLSSPPNPFHAFRRDPQGEFRKSETTLAGGWRLQQTRDTFTGITACRLDSRQVRYGGGVVTFSFGRRTDTANALFRVDGGPLRSAGEVGPEAAALGAALRSDRNTWNPTDGRVVIPWSQLKAAARVDIRPNARTYHRAFDLGALRTAVEAARAQGCTDLSA